MKKRSSVASAALVFSCILIAQSVYADESAPAGFIQERLDRIDVAIDAEVAVGRIPGAVVLIARNGKIAYHKSFGFADIESQTPMQIDSIFRIASMTKAITSVAVMMLYERGHFLLMDPVSEYLPGFASMNVVSAVDDDGEITKTEAAGKSIRIIDLLTHSSGLAYPFIPSKLKKTYEKAGLIDGITASDIKLESQMKVLAKQPLLFEPGSQFNYGLSTDVLGYLVEVISGKSLALFFRDEILTPLRMSDTYFYLPEGKSDRLVTLYAADVFEGLVVSQGGESAIRFKEPRYPVVGARSYYSGGAGLSSTAADYGRFLQMLLNDGSLAGTRILSRKSVELMRTPRVDIDGDQNPDFGLGFYVVNDLGQYGELSSVGSYSWGGAFYTVFWIDPAENLLLVFMSQARPVESDIDKRFHALVYQALE